MVHFIGQPLDTAADPRLRVRDDSTWTSSARAQRGERLVPAGLSDAIGLVILQDEPAGTYLPLGDTRGPFLALAEGMLADRAQAVLVLPTLPHDVSAGIVALLRASYTRSLRRPAPPTSWR